MYRIIFQPKNLNTNNGKENNSKKKKYILAGEKVKNDNRLKINMGLLSSGLNCKLKQNYSINFDKDGEGKVTIKSSNPEILTASLKNDNLIQINPLKVGEAIVTISMKEDGYYKECTKEISITVSKLPNSFSLRDKYCMTYEDDKFNINDLSLNGNVMVFMPNYLDDTNKITEVTSSDESIVTATIKYFEDTKRTYVILDSLNPGEAIITVKSSNDDPIYENQTPALAYNIKSSVTPGKIQYNYGETLPYSFKINNENCTLLSGTRKQSFSAQSPYSTSKQIDTVIQKVMCEQNFGTSSSPIYPKVGDTITITGYNFSISIPQSYSNGLGSNSKWLDYASGYTMLLNNKNESKIYTMYMDGRSNPNLGNLRNLIWFKVTNND